MKECHKCHESKPVNAFPNDRSAPDGKYRWCKDCSLAANRQWYLANKAKVMARIKKDRQNPVIYQAALAANRRWQKRHPAQAAHYSRRSSARARGATIIELSLADWQDLLAQAGHACTYCATPFDADHPAEQDHIIPISRGGQHVKDNITPACHRCNSKKHNKTLIEFVRSHVSR